MAKVNLKEMSKFFQDDIEKINAEIEDTDNLYSELKEHFDKVKVSYSPGSLTFISKQTANLSSVKTNRANLMKMILDIKKMIVELSIKTNSEDSDSEKNKEILKALNKLLLENSKEEFIKVINKDDEEDNQQEEEQDYDALLEKRLEENNKSTNKKNNKKKKELIYGEDYWFVVDLERNIYAIDEDYNLLEDENIEYPDWIIDYIEEEDGTIRAFTEDGDEIEIIEFDED